MVIQEISVQ